MGKYISIIYYKKIDQVTKNKSVAWRFAELGLGVGLF